MRREVIELIGLELFILGVVFAICAANWNHRMPDIQVQYVHTPDIILDGSANDQ